MELKCCFHIAKDTREAQARFPRSGDEKGKDERVSPRVQKKSPEIPGNTHRYCMRGSENGDR